MTWSFSTFCHDQTGIAAVEAALIAPFLALLCFGTVDASYLMLQNHKMEANLAAAGNYLAKTRDPKSFETQAKRLATTGQITSGGQPVIKNWTAENITLSYKKVPNTPTQEGLSYRGPVTIDMVQLTSQYSYQGIGLLRAVFGDSLTVTASYEERIVGSRS